MKTRLLSLVVLAVALLPSCSTSIGGGASLKVQPMDGALCGLVDYTTESGQSYAAGGCIGDSGKVDRYVITWNDPSGVTAAVIKYTKTGVRKVFYKASDGTWVQYTSKSGFTLGPPPVQDVTLPVEPTTPKLL